MWRLWAIIGFAVWILIVSIALDPGTSRTLLTQLSALAIIVLALWRLSSEHEELMSSYASPKGEAPSSDAASEGEAETQA